MVKEPTKISDKADSASKQKESKAPKPAIAALLVVMIAAGAALFFYNSYSKQQAGSSTTTIPSLYSASTTLGTTVTTSINPSSQLSEPSPYPPSQIVRIRASTNVTDAGASGGSSPYKYQWLGAVMNTSSNFTASFGNVICANTTAQSTRCYFQTVSGYNSLIPGIYYLKLHVSDSSLPIQVTNSSTAYVDVIN